MDIIVKDEDIEESLKIEDDPEMILRLVDLIFLCKDNSIDLPS